MEVPAAADESMDVDASDVSDLDISLAREENAQAPDEEVGSGALMYKDIYIAPPPPAVCSFDNTGPRYVIKSIVVNNFKSFHGVHVIGPFFKGMSAVIGPNGSGKSNVLDSILFVFGYRAAKIRTKKVSMLIHNSAKHPNVQNCSVTVNFVQILDKGLNVDPEVLSNTEFAITRTALKDNSSFYTINDKRVQFKDVSKKLLSHGIDLNNGRFLILQGEVEQIAQMKPKGENENDVGLLDFLEDIMGTLRYREPYAKALSLEATVEEDRESQLTKVNASEKHLKELEAEKNKAVKYLNEMNECVILQHKCHQLEIYLYNKEIAGEEEKKNEVTKNLSELKAELKEHRKCIASTEIELNEKKREFDKLMKKKNKMDQDYELVKQNDVKFREDMAAKIARRIKLKENHTKEEKKLAEMKLLPEKNAKEIIELEKLISRHEKDRTTCQENLQKATEKLKYDVQEPQEKLEKLEKELATLAKEQNEKSAAQSLAKSRLDILCKGESKSKEKLQALKNNLLDAKSNLDQKKMRLADIKHDLPTHKQEFAEVTQQLELEKAEKAKIDNQASRLQIEIQGIRTAADAAKSTNRVVAALQDQCSQGNIPGVFGRLGDLGGIDAKYDCAISSSCGSLDHIVVDKVDTGEKCINYLRDTRIGRANFLVLEKLQHWMNKARDHFKAPENVPRLFDLIKVEDERVLPAFYFSLRDTLVAKDLDQATRIGIGGSKRFRVVDLNGNVVEPVGSITGGGQPIRGRMGQKATAGLVTEVHETPQMRNNLEALLRRSNSLAESVQLLDRRERELRQIVPQMEAELKRILLEIQHFTDSIPSLEKQVQEQELKVKKTVTDQKEVKKLQAEVDSTTKAMEKATENTKETEDEVIQIRKQIEHIKNNCIGGSTNKIKDLTKKITKAQTDKTKLAAAIGAVERNSQKTAISLASLEEEISNIASELNNMKATLKEMDRTAVVVLGEREKLSETFLEMEQEISDINNKSKEIAKKELAVQKVILEVEQAAAKFDADIAKLSFKLSETKKLMKALRIEEIPGEENPMSFQTLTPEEMDGMTIAEARYSFARFKDMDSNKPDFSVIEDYYTKHNVFIKMASELDLVSQRRKEIKDFVTLIERQRFREFMNGFTIINKKLKEVFRMISMGGDAELELQDNFNPFLEGIVFSVRPRNKAWTQIDKLSGGEKTLSSLSLVFGLHYFKPSAFYMMDEIDAALDGRNVSIIGHYIKEFTTNCQFIVISLRPEMYDLFERRIIGIFKPDGCSRACALDPTAFEKHSRSEEEEESQSLQLCPSAV